jgi:hypothetical protein
MNVADLITVLEDASTQIGRAITTLYENDDAKHVALARGHAVAAYNLISIFTTLTEGADE